MIYNKHTQILFRDLLVVMEELKDSPDRERFAINFDEEYRKTKELVESFDKKEEVE